MNNYILDGVRYLWWPNVLPSGDSVCTEQGSAEFRTPHLYNPGYALINYTWFVHSFVVIGLLLMKDNCA